MTSNEIRASFLEVLRAERPPHRAQLAARARRRSDAAVHERRDEPVQGRLPRPGEARVHARHDLAEGACASAASTTTSTTSDRRSAITRSSRCSAISRSATTSRQDAIAFAWTLLTDVWKMPPDRLVVSVFKGEDGIPRDDEAYDIWRHVRAGRSHSGARHRRQLLADGRHRTVRPLLGDLLRPRRRAATPRSKSGTTCSWSSSGAPTAR